MKKDEDLKKIGELVKDAIRPLKELVEVLKYKVDGQEIFLHTTAANVRSIKEQQSVINEKLDEVRGELDEVRKDLKEVKGTQEQHTEILEKRVLPSVTYIETNIKAYKDSYQINNANAKKLEKGVETLEDNTGINPPLELTLSEVS